MNVACEACHGPGSTHVAWAESLCGGRAGRNTGSRKSRLCQRARSVRPSPWRASSWRMNFDTGIAERAAPPLGQEIDSCAPCHSRRKPIVADPPTGRDFSRAVSSCVAGTRPLSRRWADRRRGLRIWLLRSGSHVSRGCPVLGLPRAAFACASRARQRALCAMPPARKIRCRLAPSSRAWRQRRALRRLPHAGEKLYGRGCAARPWFQGAPARPHRFTRHAERLRVVSWRLAAGLGGTQGRGLVSRRPSHQAALCDGSGRRAERRRRGRAFAGGARDRSRPAGDRACERLGASAFSGDVLVRARHRSRRH